MFVSDVSEVRALEAAGDWCHVIFKSGREIEIMADTAEVAAKLWPGLQDARFPAKSHADESVLESSKEAKLASTLEIEKAAEAAAYRALPIGMQHSGAIADAIAHGIRTALQEAGLV